MNQKLLSKAIIAIVTLSGIFCKMDASTNIRVSKGAPSDKPKIKSEAKRESVQVSAAKACEVSALQQLLNQLKTAQSQEVLKTLRDICDMLASMKISEIKVESVTLCRMFDLVADTFPRISRHGEMRYKTVEIIADIEKIVVPKLTAMPVIRDKAKKKVNNLFFVIGRSEIRIPRQSQTSENPKKSREQVMRAREDLLRKVQWSSFVSDKKAKPVASEKKKETVSIKSASKVTKPKSCGKRSEKFTA